jgi:hypothetical protein
MRTVRVNFHNSYNLEQQGVREFTDELHTAFIAFSLLLCFRCARELATLHDASSEWNAEDLCRQTLRTRLSASTPVPVKPKPRALVGQSESVSRCDRCIVLRWTPTLIFSFFFPTPCFITFIYFLFVVLENTLAHLSCDWKRRISIGVSGTDLWETYGSYMCWMLPDCLLLVYCILCSEVL